MAGVLETFGGVALLLGLFTRSVPFVIADEMAVAYFQTHAPRGFYPIANRGDTPVLFCFVYLYLTFAGGGVWSLDDLLDRARERGVEAESAGLTPASTPLPASLAGSPPSAHSTSTA